MFIFHTNLYFGLSSFRECPHVFLCCNLKLLLCLLIILFSYKFVKKKIHNTKKPFKRRQLLSINSSFNCKISFNIHSCSKLTLYAAVWWHRIITNVSSTNGPFAVVETKWIHLKNVLITGQNVKTWASHKRLERVTKGRLCVFCSSLLQLSEYNFLLHIPPHNRIII